MKVIFLDVDYVLNTIDTFKRRKQIYNEVGLIIHRIDLFRVSYLKEIVDNTGAKIVLSSTWRKYEDHLKELKDVLQLFDLEIFDVLGKNDNKGYEIINWLKNNEVDSFVILDDETYDLKNLEEYVVKTRKNRVATGLLSEHIPLAINILNKSKKLVLNNKEK